MLTIKYQTAFKKDYKRIVRRGYDVRLLEEVISILAEQKPLPEIYRDHNLSGDYIGRFTGFIKAIFCYLLTAAVIPTTKLCC